MVQKTAKFRVSSVKHKSFFVCLAGWLVCWFKKKIFEKVCWLLVVVVMLFVCLFLLLLLVCVCVLLFLVVFCRTDITALVDWA